MDKAMRSRGRTMLALQEHMHHARSLSSAKSLTDTSQPRCGSALGKKRKGKTAYLKRERELRIFRENSMLYTKLKTIMTKPKSALKKPRKHSLNRTARIAEFKKITAENSRLCLLLAQAQPVVNLSQFSQSYKKQTQYMHLLTDKPPHERIWTVFQNAKVAKPPKRKRKK